MANPTVEMSLKLPLASLMANVPDNALAWRGSYLIRLYDGERFEIAFRIDRDGDRANATLRHRGRSLRLPNGGGIQSYSVEMVSAPQPFGGLRWWWRCPQQHSRCDALFLPLGGLRFMSRQAYRLPYATQRMAPMERKRTKLRRQCARLGGISDLLGELPGKPSGMRWRTYDRRIAKLEPVQEAVSQDFARSVSRAFGLGGSEVGGPAV